MTKLNNRKGLRSLFTQKSFAAFQEQTFKAIINAKRRSFHSTGMNESMASVSMI